MKNCTQSIVVKNFLLKIELFKSLFFKLLYCLSRVNYTRENQVYCYIRNVTVGTEATFNIIKLDEFKRVFKQVVLHAKRRYSGVV